MQKSHGVGGHTGIIVFDNAGCPEISTTPSLLELLLYTLITYSFQTPYLSFRLLSFLFLSTLRSGSLISIQFPYMALYPLPYSIFLNSFILFYIPTGIGLNNGYYIKMRLSFLLLFLFFLNSYRLPKHGTAMVVYSHPRSTPRR